MYHKVLKPKYKKYLNTAMVLLTQENTFVLYWIHAIPQLEAELEAMDLQDRYPMSLVLLSCYFVVLPSKIVIWK